MFLLRPAAGQRRSFLGCTGCFKFDLWDNTPISNLPVCPGEPWAPHWVLTMLRQSEPTSSTLQLVASDMTGIIEKLDPRELQFDDGDYDTTDSSVPGIIITSPSTLCFLHIISVVCFYYCIFFHSRLFAFYCNLQHSWFQGGRGQSLLVLTNHRQNPGGGAFHLSSGPLQCHHTEERQQGDQSFTLLFCQVQLFHQLPLHTFKYVLFRL